MSVLNIVLFCAAGFLLGIVISWLVSNIASRLRNRTARRRVEPQMNVKKGIKTMDLILVIIGALNWGGVGLFAFDCVAFICGGQLAALSRIIYALVGIAGLWCITMLFRESSESN